MEDKTKSAKPAIINLSDNNQLDHDTKTKVSLISLLVVIFILSLGLIAWVLIKEQSVIKEDVIVKELPIRPEEVYIAKNPEQEELLEVKDEFDDIESDIDELYGLLNDVNADKYGEALD